MSRTRYWVTETDELPTTNNTNIIIRLSANGADLPNWLSWYNHKFRYSLNGEYGGNYQILKELGVLKYDIVNWQENINRWLLSVYSGTAF